MVGARRRRDTAYLTPCRNCLPLNCQGQAAVRLQTVCSVRPIVQDHQWAPFPYGKSLVTDIVGGEAVKGSASPGALNATLPTLVQNAREYAFRVFTLPWHAPSWTVQTLESRL